jgi:hypothetical protein
MTSSTGPGIGSPAIHRRGFGIRLSRARSFIARIVLVANARARRTPPSLGRGGCALDPPAASGCRVAPTTKRGRRAQTPGPWHRAKQPQSRCGGKGSYASGAAIEGGLTNGP